MNTITFKGTEYEVGERFAVNPVLAADGMREQFAIFGKRGSAGLMQVFDNSRRVVWLKGARTEYEYGAALARAQG